MVCIRKGKSDPRFAGIEDIGAVNFWKKSIHHRRYLMSAKALGGQQAWLTRSQQEAMWLAKMRREEEW